MGTPDATNGGPAPPAPAAASAERLPLAVIWTYSLPTVGVGFLGMLFGVYLMKYSTDVLLIAPAAMGAIFAVGRLWDAASDPLAGFLSDRSTARRGRRRAWMAAAALPMLAGTVMVWSPPPGLEGLGLILWMGLAMLAWETASTVFFVPHGALGMELSRSHHERTRVFGWRHAIAAVGSAVGLAGIYLLRTSESPRFTALALALLGGGATAAMILFAAARLPERSDHQGRGAARIDKAILDVFRNPHARLLLFVYGIETFGAAAIGMLAPFVLQYVVGRPDQTEVFIAAYFIPQFVLTPLWIALSRRVGKKRLWLFSMVCQTLAFAGLFLVPAGSTFIIFGLALLVGVGGGCAAVVAPSIQADVIDYDELRTGERKEGAYLAVWNLVRKGSAALTPILAGVVLEATGYVPDADQNETTVFAMRALIGLLPASCYVIGTLIFLRFALGEREHAAVRAALDARARAAGTSHPDVNPSSGEAGREGPR